MAVQVQHRPDGVLRDPAPAASTAPPEAEPAADTAPGLLDRSWVWLAVAMLVNVAVFGAMVGLTALAGTVGP